MFDCYPWQLQQWQQLLSANTNLPHSLLLIGPCGIGKRDFAQALAQALLCFKPQQHGKACHRCRSCTLFIAGNHPDCYLLNARGNQIIKVDAIRALTDFSVTTSQYHHNKIIIIDSADNLNTAAGNALLKTLEEPANDVYLVLLSQRPSHLLATIRSRCHIVKFNRPPKIMALDWLEKQEVKKPLLALSLAHGAPLLALTLVREKRVEKQQLLLTKWCHFSTGQCQLSQLSQQWSSLELIELLPCIIAWIMDMIRCNRGHPCRLVYDNDNAIVLRKIALNCKIKLLFEYFDKLNHTYLLLIKQVNLNKQLLLEDLLITWHQMITGERNVS